MDGIALLGRVPVAPLDLAGAAAAILGRDPAMPFGFVVPVNAQVLLLAEDAANGLRAAMAEALFCLNDSGVLARLHRAATGERVPVAPGSDLAELLLSRGLRPDDAVTVIGGGPTIAADLRECFGLDRVAHHEPPMGYMDRPDAREAAARFVEEHPARVTFVATGAPRSERLMAEIARRGRATGTGIAVGSGLLFAVGRTARAPEWFRRHGLEWAHRAWTEPRRLGRRYAADALPLLRLAWRARQEALEERRAGRSA